MNSVADVWQVVLERLRAGGLAETAISTWFDEVEAVAIRDMTFYLCCPNEGAKGASHIDRPRDGRWEKSPSLRGYRPKTPERRKRTDAGEKQ